MRKPKPNALDLALEPIQATFLWMQRHQWPRAQGLHCLGRRDMMELLNTGQYNYDYITAHNLQRIADHLGLKITWLDSLSCRKLFKIERRTK